MLDDLDFADDLALLSQNVQQMKSKTTKLEETANQIGLNINKSKTKVMKINGKGKQKIKVESGELEEVEEFSYLGSVLSRSGGTDEDIKTRIGKAQAAFMMLQELWMEIQAYQPEYQSENFQHQR